MAPATGFEPVTSKLTASCATAAPRRNTWVIIAPFIEVVNPLSLPNYPSKSAAYTPQRGDRRSFVLATIYRCRS